MDTKMIWESIGAFAAIYGFAVFLGVPKNLLIACGIDGAVGWFIYLLAEQKTDSLMISTFVGAAVISIGAHVCARIMKKPVTMFLIPANMTLVPGAGMYRIVYSILQSNDTMAAFYLSQTLQIAGVIALAMFMVSGIWGAFSKGMKELQKNK